MTGELTISLQIQNWRGNYAAIWNPDGTPDPDFCNGWVMQTVSIPLADINAAGINVRKIKKITLEFSDQCTGQVYMDDLQFSE